jgi:DNA-binding Lrp family transcriptional regulator
MRPIAEGRSFIQFPLNELLGKPAHVRLLRVLCDELAGPLSVPEAAERTGLTAAGARRALDRLVKTGFVLRIGDGRSHHVGVRADDPIIGTLRALFDTERARFDRLIVAMRETLQRFREIEAAWIDELPEDVGEPLNVHLLTSAASLTGLASEVRRRVATLEEELDVTIEIHPHTQADLPLVDWQAAILLAGLPPTEERPRSRTAPTHADREERALRLSRAIASLLDRDASLISRAVRHIDRTVHEDVGAASHDLQEWKDILTSYSRERLKSFLVSDSPRAARLRQSSPFFAVLTPDERDSVLATLDES